MNLLQKCDLGAHLPVAALLTALSPVALEAFIIGLGGTVNQTAVSMNELVVILFALSVEAAHECVMAMSGQELLDALGLDELVLRLDLAEGIGHLTAEETLQMPIGEAMELVGVYSEAHPAPPSAPGAGYSPWVLGKHERTCELLPQEYVEARAAELYRMANRSAVMRGLLGSFMSDHSLDTNPPRSACTRTIVDYGLPTVTGWGVGGYMKRARDALFDFFGVGGSVFGWSRWRGRCETQHLRVRMYTHRWHYEEGMDLLSSDTIYVAFSRASYIYLALTSLPDARDDRHGPILMSLPLALLFYPFRFIREHLIAIFLSLGVGADDLFVFVHAWRRAGRLARCKGYGRDALIARMELTYAHTSSMVLTTSLTTAMSFVGTAVSPIFSVASLGLYAARCILMNWVLTVTFWPATMALYQRISDWWYLCCCRRCCRLRLEGDEAGTSKTRGRAAVSPFERLESVEMTSGAADTPLSRSASPRPSVALPMKLFQGDDGGGGIRARPVPPSPAGGSSSSSTTTTTSSFVMPTRLP